LTQLCFDLDMPLAAPPARQQHRGLHKHRHKHRRGQLAYLAGLAAEDQVVTQYLTRGYHLEAARWRGKAGEIDLILRPPDRDGFVFVEVKKSRSFGHALARVSARQAQRIMRAAEEFLGQCGAGLLTNMRFDVAMVDAQGQIEVLENAFAGGGWDD
jgi:putative endonuclease